MNNIKLAKTDQEILDCFLVIKELRPHIGADEFLPRVKQLAAATGFQLACALDNATIKAVAGFRISEWLAVNGKYLEIEDFVTRADERSKGFGGALFDWLVAFARENGCTHLRLVSNVVRTDAHRFYERKGMAHLANYFSINLE